MSFSWRFLLCVSIPFFLMMVTEGIMHIASPILSNMGLLIRVGNSLIGVKMKLWFSIEWSSCKKDSMVELLIIFISQSFFKWLNSLFVGLMRPFDIVYSLPISIEGWNYVAWMLKHVMCISLAAMSMLSKLNTCTGPLALVRVKRSIFERNLAFKVHSW